MIFERPIGIGDLIRFRTRVVHVRERVVRIWVMVEVLDPARADGVARRRTNLLCFNFLQPEGKELQVYPETYSDCLMHINARRWHDWQGPSKDDLLSRGLS